MEAAIPYPAISASVFCDTMNNMLKKIKMKCGMHIIPTGKDS
jgi:hypothetical protein